MEKKDLWQLLYRAENQARSKAQGVTGILCISADPGREALALLNWRLGKGGKVRLKQYRPEELDLAEGIVKDLDFLQELTARFVEDGSSMESQLSVLRAQRLASLALERIALRGK